VAVGRKAVLSRTVIQNSIVEQESEIDQMVLENSIIGRQAGIKGRAEAINIGDNSWIEI
jgi:glucose-1-phosphate thymidylyltransferase